MGTKSSNKNLHKASKAKKDEFYTQMADIEKELMHYKSQFRGKVVYLNCDDPYESNFFKYFASNFNALGLKKLIATSFLPSPIIATQLTLPGMEAPEKPSPKSKSAAKGDKHAWKIEISQVRDEDADGAFDLKDIAKLLIANKHNELSALKGNGDFRSDECIELLKQADIVVTNPPFSLFREYVAQLMGYKKKFLILGNVNAITYKECFKIIKDNKMWLGVSIHSGDREFQVPDDYPLNAAGSRIDKDGKKYIRVKGVRWFTNFDYKERHQNFDLYKKYKPEEYPKYDNYNGINVDKTSEMPADYKGAMGVPITFLDKYNPEQFEIIGQGRQDLCEGMSCMSKKFVEDYYKSGGTGFYREGNPLLGYYNSDSKAVIPYMRILIKNKKVKK